MDDDQRRTISPMGGQRARTPGPEVVVGRRAELAALDRVLADTRTGQLGLVLVQGEGGIGKTSLVRDFARAASTAGARVMTGACLELGRTIPYLPFAEMLRDLSRDLSEQERAALLGPDRDVLAPFLRPDTATAGRATQIGQPAREVSGELARLALFESMLRLAERLAAHRPLVLVLEDVQWADRATLDLVTFLARNLRDARIMLVMTTRSGGPTADAVMAFSAGLERHERVERIELGPLEVEDTARQLAGILGRMPAPDLARQIHRRSGGNPLFAEELLTWTLSGATAGAPRDAAASPRLRDMVAVRVGQLPPEAHDVLRLASAAGRIVDDDVLVAACGLPAPTVIAGIRAAVEHGLLVPASLDGREGYAFRHDLVREAVAAELLPGERARLHEAFALALTSGRARTVDPGELAYHWDAAGDDARALVSHVDAGLAAQAVFAFEAAEAHLERALALWPRVPGADGLTQFDRIDLVLATAHAAAMAGDHARTIELERAVLGELGPDAADERAIVALEQLRRSLWESGDTAGALVEAETAIRIIGPAPSRARALALGHLAALLLFTGDVRRARSVAAHALELARSIEAREATALAGGVLGWSLMYAGQVEASLMLIRIGANAAEELGEIHGRALAKDHLARALEMGGRHADAAGVAVQGAELCRSRGLGRTYGALLAADGTRSLWALGRIQEAAALAEVGLAAGPVGPGQVALLTAAALVHVDRDDLAAADATLAEVTALTGPAGDPESTGWIAVVRASSALRRGDPAAALDILRRTTSVGAREVPGADSPTASLVQLGASVGPLLRLAARATAELVLLERARGAMAGDGVRPPDRRRLEWLLDWLARRTELAAALATSLAIARAELRRAEAPAAPESAAAWRRVLEVDRGRPSPSAAAQAYACLRLGEALAVGHEQRHEAASAVREGLALASAGGMTALEADLALLARRARLPLGPAATTRPGAAGPDGGAHTDALPFGLTEREVEVLRLVAAGLTNREIGERLFISPKTASVHVSAILAKLDVSGRLDAALVAQQVGLYEPTAGSA